MVPWVFIRGICVIYIDTGVYGNKWEQTQGDNIE